MAQRNAAKSTSLVPVTPVSIEDTLPPIDYGQLKDRSIAELTEMALTRFSVFNGAMRKAALEAFRLGAILFHVREKYKGSQMWMQWLIGFNWNHSTANIYIKLYERAGSESAVEGLMLSAAKAKFFDVPKSEKETTAPPTPQPSPVSTTGSIRECISKALEILLTLKPGEFDAAELQQVKELTAKVNSTIAELEARNATY